MPLTFCDAFEVQDVFICMHSLLASWAVLVVLVLLQDCCFLEVCWLAMEILTYLHHSVELAELVAEVVESESVLQKIEKQIDKNCVLIAFNIRWCEA